MRKLFRLSSLLLIAVALALGAAALLLRSGGAEYRAVPEPLGDDDQEIAWLFTANNAAGWERFVTAVGTAARRRHAEGAPELVVDDSRAFPPQTTAVPELAVSVQGARGHLRFRWYKLTSEIKTADWVQALVFGRRRPPLAILSGSSSDQAIELANVLQEETSGRGGVKPPLLLLVQATSDQGARRADGQVIGLTRIYDHATFRFCFTNQQMSDAVTDWIWGQEDLRPDSDPVYLAMWKDDAYSMDLTERFCTALRARASRYAARYWAWSTAALGTGAFPIDLNTVRRSLFRMTALPFPVYIEYSVGSFSKPNRWEAQASQTLMDELARHRQQHQPLLVLPGVSQPARRLLTGLMRIDPKVARRFVVATGDSIAFNTIYRDRNVGWAIQDLPFKLVFFCHRNPVDAGAGFQPEGEAPSTEVSNGGLPATTGTEDLLLDVDIVEALVQAAYPTAGAEGGPSLPANGDELGRHLRQAQLREGQVSFDSHGPFLFDDAGNRRGRTGEHIVCLRPVIENGWLLPRATIQVWAESVPGAGDRWQLVRELPVTYGEYAGEPGS